MDNDPGVGRDFQLSPSITHSQTFDESTQGSEPIAEDIALATMSRRMSTLNVPLYQMLPLTGIDDSPLARSYTSYRDEARHMLANGVSTHELFGSSKIRVDLLFRSRSDSDPHSICNWATELCAALSPDFDTRWTLASILMLARFMRVRLFPFPILGATLECTT